MDDKTLKELVINLNERLEELKKNLERHENQTTVKLPENWTDARPIKEQIEITEVEEEIENKEINAILKAYRRIANDNYGMCMSCGEDIPVERLKIRPESEYCVHCKEEKEEKSEDPSLS